MEVVVVEVALRRLLLVKMVVQEVVEVSEELPLEVLETRHQLHRRKVIMVEVHLHQQVVVKMVAVEVVGQVLLEQVPEVIILMAQAVEQELLHLFLVRR
jgi:hypothetical protein